MTKVVQALITRVPHQRIGIIARTVGRRRFVEETLTAASLPFYRWDDGVLDTDTASVLKSLLARFDVRGYDAASDKTAFLRAAAGFESIADPTGRESLLSALLWCHDLLGDRISPTEIRSRIRVGDSTTLITIPGVHLLTGHVGKGQQFDWVMIVGVEDGVLPDLPREDRGMLSRARHGVIVNRAVSVPTKAGKPMDRAASSFLGNLAAASPLDGAGLVAWFNAADWAAIAAR